MILCYPENASVVEKYTTFELIRAKLLLGPPDTPSERAVCRRVNERLAETNREHRETIEKAVGFGTL